MGISFSNLVENERTVAIDINGEDLHVTYRPSKLSPAFMSRITEDIEEDDELAFAKLFCQVVSAWDLEAHSARTSSPSHTARRCLSSPSTSPGFPARSCASSSSRSEKTRPQSRRGSRDASQGARDQGSCRASSRLLAGRAGRQVPRSSPVGVGRQAALLAACRHGLHAGRSEAPGEATTESATESEAAGRAVSLPRFA